MPEQLEELMEDVRATAPQPRDEFLATMERRVEEGFPRRTRRFPALRSLAPAFAALVIALVVAVPLATLDRGDDDEAEPASGGAESAQVEEQQSLSTAQSPKADQDAAHDYSRVTPAPSSGGGGAGQRERRLVERRVTLELQTGSDEFDKTTAGVLEVADSRGAIVQSSAVEERDGRGYATYDLRVPTSRLDEALRDLGRLAKVTARSASSDDITTPYVSAQARLDDARDQRRALLRALANADTANETDAIRARLRDARQRIAAAEAAVRRLRNRADRARVDVTVESTGKVTDTAWTPGDALDDAGRVLEVALGVALVAGAVLLPLAILALLAIATSRVLRRRRREAALG